MLRSLGWRIVSATSAAALQIQATVGHWGILRADSNVTPLGVCYELCHSVADGPHVMGWIGAPTTATKAPTVPKRVPNKGLPSTL